MKDGKILYKNLQQQNTTRDKLIAKPLETNVLKLEDVRAVVLETTGDISVLHGNTLEEELLCGVKQ